MSEASFHEEEAITRAYDGRLMWRLLQYLRPYALRVAAALGLLIAGAALALAGPYLVGHAIDRYIMPGDVAGLTRISVLFFALLLATFGIDYAETHITQMVGQGVMYDMRMQVFRHIQSLPLSFFDRNPVGRLMTRITSDIETLNDMFTSGVVTIAGDLVTLVGIVVALLYLNTELALITFAVVPLLFFAAFLFKTRVRDAYRNTRLRIARINAYLQENISGMKVVQLFNREDRNYDQFRELNRQYADAFLQTIFYYAVFYPVVEILSALALASIIWWGGHQVLEGMLTHGGLVAFIMYAQRFYRPIQDLSEKYNIIQSAMASSERVFKILETQDTVPDAPHAAAVERLRGAIAFEGVWFAYRGDDHVLKDVSFRVEPGQTVAIVGATGAGKTTIINLLSRFYDVQRGRISIDGIDVRAMHRVDLRRHIGVVLQDVFLFSGDILENIRLWDERITPAAVERAARQVHADQFISRFPQGYRQAVTERGSTLSTGHKQLLAFARALAYDPQILVLDEATSNIDTETEQLIQDALRKLLRNRTSIIIAHRLSTIQHADRILVMHHGRLREEGTHQELLQQRGLYYRLYQLQYRDQEIPAAVNV